MSFHHVWTTITSIPKSYFWLIQSAAIIVLAAFLHFSHHVLYHRLMRYLKKTHRIWDDLVLYALHGPLAFLIWLIALTAVLDIVHSANKSLKILAMVGSARNIGILLFVAWALMRFTRLLSIRLVHPQYKKQPLDKTAVDAVTRIFHLLIIIIVGLMALHEFGIPVSGVLAFGGGGALVVGFAAKDLFANFIGGLIIYLDRPFSVGDWVRSPDKEIEGTVEHIGWRSTCVRTFDKRPLYVPNSIFSNVSIENPSRMTNRRIMAKFGVRYRDATKVSAIVSDIEDMLRHHPEIDTRETLFVKLIEFGDYSLNILIYTFTKTTQWVKFQAIQEDVFLKIIDIVFSKHHAEISSPVRVLEFQNKLPSMELMAQQKEEA